MGSVRIALLVSVFACAVGPAGAQLVWVPYEGNPVIPRPGPDSWYEQARWVDAVVKVDGLYHLFFNGTATIPFTTFQDFAIGHATSSDGITWEMDPSNPVLTPDAEGDWEVTTLIGSAVIHDDVQFRMWYGGGDAQGFEVGYATSPDGSTWTRHPGNPVMEPGPTGSFDDFTIFPNSVIDEGGLLKMWYTAAKSSPGGGLSESIAYATSTDGVSWTKHRTPVLESEQEWENFAANMPWVVYDGTSYHMWYVGYHALAGSVTNIAIGYAVSPDGIEWTKDAGNPIEELGDPVSMPVVLRDGVARRYEMFYTKEFEFSAMRATADFNVPMDRLLFIPAAALASGAEGSFFETDVDVNSTAPAASMLPVSYRFWWLPRGRSNSTPTASEVFVLDPGESMRHRNILASVFDLEPNALGALAIATDSEYLIAMSRTYNVPAEEVAGTFGQALPAVPFDGLITTGETGRITFMTEDADVRANLGCVNGRDTPVAIDITEHDAAGAVLEHQTLDLGPRSNQQINRILHDFAPVDGYVDVSTSTADAAFTCYGSVLDNLTSDPTSTLPQTPSPSTMSFIPAAALAGGAQGSFFETDVDLNNAGDTMSTYSLLWLPRAENNSSPTASDTFTLDAGASVRYENVLSELFGAEPNALGALALSTDGGYVLVMSRTYNIPSVNIAGTFGQALEAIPADRLLHTGEVGRIIFLTENDDIRSNIGCVNGTDSQVAIDIVSHDSNGEVLEERTMNLAAWSNKQVNQILEDFAPVDGYVDVSSATPDAAFTCYGSVLDNATSDPTTIPPQ